MRRNPRSRRRFSRFSRVRFPVERPLRPRAGAGDAGRAGVVAWLAIASVLVAFVPQVAGAAAPDPAWSRGGMVASSVGPAVNAGREVLERGGNAVDAAIATGFAAGCAHHFSSGIGGGGFIVVRTAEGESFAIDARETAPAAATADMYVGADGEVNREASRTGGLAVATPGLVQGFVAAHERFGKLAWRDVIAPAIALCRAGVPVSPYHQRILAAAKEKLEKFPETRRIQLPPGGEVPELGWTLVQTDLADTYAVIAERGAAAMTEGPIARAMVKAVQEAGGILTLADLAGYEPVWREPVSSTYRGYEVVSMPPPSSGGALLIEMLNTLEPFDLRAKGAGSSASIHLIAEAMKLAFADRAVYLGDPDFYRVPTAWLISKRYGREQARRLEPRPFWRKPPWRWGRETVLRVDRPSKPPRDDSGTTHISVMDASGMAVAITQTVNTLFGAGITAPGTGIVLNNEMDDFAAAPDAPNAFGLVGDLANAVAPGKRPLSSMTPTIVSKDGRAVIVAGSPMGPLIITTVLQTLLNVIDYQMDIEAAVSAPRVHHQWKPDELRLEAEHPRDVVEALEAMGHPVRQSPRTMGASASVSYDPEIGLFYGASDPRRDARAAGP